MKRTLAGFLLLFGTLAALPVRAQTDSDSIRRQLEAPAVVVMGRRPMKAIGEQRTELDTAALRETIAASLADVLSQHTTLFIKQYGRGTLSTASFRGTSPSHTQTLWNGMRINSPMVGMTDFSMIPAYFVDEAGLLHGSSSLRAVGGGLGGAVLLANRPVPAEGLGLQYIQGVGSFKTADEFLRLTYGRERWQISTRVAYASSPNDFRYTNYHKKINRYDDEGNLTDSSYPTERNRSGDYHDLHLLQEAYCRLGADDRLSLSAWYLDSRRGVPMLDVDYKEEAEFSNRQHEKTFRGVLAWDRTRQSGRIGAKAGYAWTHLAYDYTRDLGNGSRVRMIQSCSEATTFFGKLNGDWYLNDRWMFSADLSLHTYFVASRDEKAASLSEESATVGYDRVRSELSGYVSVRWQPAERFGVAASLREELCGLTWSPVIPAGFVDYRLSRRGSVMLKASVSRNYRFPTLNDLYFLPGGNPELKPERGFTYDGGLSASGGRPEGWSWRAEAVWFDSRIDDWIVWLPTFNGFWTPRNVRRVHAYGTEFKAGLGIPLAREWRLELDGNFAWTPSVNLGDPVDWADEAIGKQLVYVPKYSSALTGRLSWRSWKLTYDWRYYSERYTTSSNEMATRIGRVLPYFMNNLSIEKSFAPSWADLSVKVRINNLFNEEYESVLSHPMPRLNVEFFFDIRPRIGRKNREGRDAERKK